MIFKFIQKTVLCDCDLYSESHYPNVMSVWPSHVRTQY